MNHYDVLVVGGGPAGAAAALTLCQYTNLKVGVVEAGTFSEEMRVGETVSPAIKSTLEYLGVWETFKKANHHEANSAKAAWGSETLQERHYLFSGRGTGWHLDRVKFDRDLCLSIETFGGKVILDSKVNQVTKINEGWEISATGKPQHLSCKMLIDATGRKASVARMAGVEQTVIDRLTGIMGVFDTAEQMPGEILLETMPTGWWYASALPNKKLTLVYMTDADIIREYHYHDLEKWGDLVCETTHIYPLLDKAKLNGELIIRPAHTRYLSQPCGNGWLATGDAAMSFDPISSLGIGHALTTGIQAARVVDARLKGDASFMESYAGDLMQHFNEFERHYLEFYGLEKRWPTEAFWQRRNRVLSV